jgi:hypothetical protein
LVSAFLIESMFSNILILLITFLYPKENQQQTARKYDSIESKSIHVKNAHNTVYSLGTPLQLQHAFGKTKILKQKDEMLGGYGYTHKFDGLIVYFNENEFENLAVTNAQYPVYLNGEVFKIGDNDVKLKKVFPLAYAERSTEADHTRILRLQIRHGKTMSDAAVVITLNVKSAITEIWIGNDNS